MLDIFESLFFDECLIIMVFQGVLRYGSGHKGAWGVIDPVMDLHAKPHNIYDLDRYSYGSRQRVRVIEMR